MGEMGGYLVLPFGGGLYFGVGRRIFVTGSASVFLGMVDLVDDSSVGKTGGAKNGGVSKALRGVAFDVASGIGGITFGAGFAAAIVGIEQPFGADFGKRRKDPGRGGRIL